MLGNILHVTEGLQSSPGSTVSTNQKLLTDYVQDSVTLFMLGYNDKIRSIFAIKEPYFAINSNGCITILRSYYWLLNRLCFSDHALSVLPLSRYDEQKVQIKCDDRTLVWVPAGQWAAS